MSRKKIALFHMLPSGGGIRVAGRFASVLSERFDVEIHRPVGGGVFPTDVKIPEIVYSYPLWRKPAGILRTIAPLFLVVRLLAFKKVCRIIASRLNELFDAVLVHNSMPVAAAPLLEFLSIPSLYFCYEYPRHIYEKDIIRRTESPLTELALKPLELFEKHIDLHSAARASEIATLSSYMAGRVKEIYGRDSTVVSPGVDTRFFSPEGKTGKENIVLSVGALWPFKGHETVIKIVAKIPMNNRPELIITADREYPGYRKKLITLAERHAVKTSIKSGISDTALRHLYRSSKAVLCCQKREPYGLVPLEAMACGTPVIAVSQGGFTDNIKHRETGFLFDGSVDSGARLLLETLSGHAGEHIGILTNNALEFVRTKRNLGSGTALLTKILGKL